MRVCVYVPESSQAWWSKERESESEREKGGRRMFAFLRGGLGNALRSKAGLAIIAAVLVGGGGTAMGMVLANSHARSPSAAHSATLLSHPTATATARVSPTSVAGGGRGHHGHHHHSNP